ncbi:MAG TPA: hypothetical protein VH482_14265 [Thermomicrobiales bacterium]
MLAAFVERIGTLFDRRFIIAHWAPTIIAAVAMGGVVLVRVGRTRPVDWWTELSADERLWLAFAVLLTLTAIANILAALTTTTVRWYEGYNLPGPLRDWGRTRQLREWQQLTNRLQDDDAYQRRYFAYPQDSGRVRPTRLGNVLTAAEEYPQRVYRLDAVIWWPRLAPLLPEVLRAQIDAVVTPLVALLNLSSLLTVVSLIGGGFLFLTEERAWPFVVVFGGGLIVARLCYVAAIGQAAAYGSVVRASFDLHRTDVLKQMRIPVPDSWLEERRTWAVMNQLAFKFQPPWQNPPFPGTDPTTILDESLFPFRYAKPEAAAVEKPKAGAGR